MDSNELYVFVSYSIGFSVSGNLDVVSKAINKKGNIEKMLESYEFYRASNSSEKLLLSNYIEVMALPTRSVSVGADLIKTERKRQISAEGYDRVHDSKFNPHLQLIEAAESYLESAKGEHTDSEDPPLRWPWAKKHWKPSSPTSDLKKAGALIAAELDRING